MKRLRSVIIFLAVLMPLWGEDFFPIGLWSVDKGGFGEAHRESLLIHKSGGNVLCNADKPKSWLDSCQNFNDTIRICAREPFSSSPYRGAWYAVGHRLPFYYPWVYGSNQDSLVWWNNLADMWIDTIYGDYQSYFSVVYLYDVMLTGSGSGEPVVSSPSFPEGVDSLCVRIKNKEYWDASQKTFGYGGTQSGRFLSKTKDMDVITRIPVSSPPVDSSPGYAAFQGSVLDRLIKSCENHHKWFKDLGHSREFWPEIPIYKTASCRRPTEAEMRAMCNVSLAWDVKGFTFFSYKPTENYTGILDSQRRPYMPEDSVIPVLGESLDAHSPEDTSDYGYLWFYHLTKDLKILGPHFRRIEWDTAHSIKIEKKYEEINEWNNSLKYVKKIVWQDSTPTSANIGDTIYGELALFKDEPGVDDLGDYFFIVNRHTRPEDTVKLSVWIGGKYESYDSLLGIDMLTKREYLGYKESISNLIPLGPFIIPPGDGKLIKIILDIPAVVYPDIEIVSIDEPGTWSVDPDTVWAGATYQPKATVRNNEPVDAIGIYIVCTADGYTSSRTIDLNSEQTKQITFDDWSTFEKPCSTYTMRVEATYPDDSDSTNNLKQKQYNNLADVQVISIDEPAEIWTGMTYTPKATIKNNSLQGKATLDVTCTIDGYSSTKTANLLAAGDQTQVIFDDWASPEIPCDELTIEVSAPISCDLNQADNTISKTLTNKADVQVVSIDEPSEIWAASIKNNSPESNITFSATAHCIGGKENHNSGNQTFKREIFAKSANMSDVKIESIIIPSSVKEGNNIFPRDESQENIILASDIPVGIWTGTTYIPKATVKNKSPEGQTIFDVTCAIDGYNSIKTVSLPAGDQMQVVFDDWTSPEMPCDTFTMEVNVFIPCDPDQDDNVKDKTLLNKADVTVVSIDEPSDIVLTGTSYIPKITVKNSSPTGKVTFDLNCTINSTAFLIAGFGSQIISPERPFYYKQDSRKVSVRRNLSNPIPSVNIQRSSGLKTPEYQEISIRETNRPTKPEIGSFSRRNPSRYSLVYPREYPFPKLPYGVSSFEQMNGYSETEAVISLPAGEEREISFPDWTTSLSACATYDMTVAANITCDPNPGDNDTGQIIDAQGDVGIIDAIDPLDSVYVDSTYDPTVTLKNFTSGFTEPFSCSLYIEDEENDIIYQSVVSINGLTPNEEKNITFDKWVPEDTGTYSLYATSYLPCDDNSNNNTWIWNVKCVSPKKSDVGALKINTPSSIRVGEAIKPDATVQNYGELTSTFNVACQIEASSRQAYVDTVKVTNLSPGDTANVVFEDWAPTEGGLYVMSVKTLLIGDTDPFNDFIQKTINALGIEGTRNIPLRFDLSTIKPNPFSQDTEIFYQLPHSSKASLSIYDISGKLVRNLVTGASLPGYYSTIWNGRDNSNRDVAAGIYFIRFVTPDYKAIKKLILLTR